MNWEKTKSIFLFLLALLNILLMLMLWYNDRQYTFGEGKRAAIEQLLDKMGIGIETEIPKRFSPMKSLKVNLKSADAGQLQKVFFDKDADVRRTIELEKIILRSGTASLTIGGSKAVYENPDASGYEGLSDAEIIAYCGEYIKRLKPILGKMEFSSLSVTEGRYTVVFFGKYGGYKLFNSSVVFELGGSEKERVSISLAEIAEAVRIKKDICSPDEALLTLIHYLRENAESPGRLIIKRMELGYFIDGAFDSSARVVKAVPCYRINISSEDGSGIRDIFIDAYVNRVKSD